MNRRELLKTSALLPLAGILANVAEGGNTIDKIRYVYQSHYWLPNHNYIVSYIDDEGRRVEWYRTTAEEKPLQEVYEYFLTKLGDEQWLDCRT